MYKNTPRLRLITLAALVNESRTEHLRCSGIIDDVQKLQFHTCTSTIRFGCSSKSSESNRNVRYCSLRLFDNTYPTLRLLSVVTIASTKLPAIHVRAFPHLYMQGRLLASLFAHATPSHMHSTLVRSTTSLHARPLCRLWCNTGGEIVTLSVLVSLCVVHTRTFI